MATVSGATTTDGTMSNTSVDGYYSSLSKDSKKNNSTLDVDDFLQLMVTQMQYQDPLEPTDNTQYIAQMATFSQVQATTDMQATTEQQMATKLVGQYVMLKTSLTSTGYTLGKVDYWEKKDGVIYLGIGDCKYDIKDLDTVIGQDFYDKYLQSLKGENSTSTESGTSSDSESDL